MRHLPRKLSPIKRYLKGAAGFAQALLPMLLIAYLLLLLLETVLERSVSYYLNLDYLLIIVIVVGVIAVLGGPREVAEEKGERLSRRSLLIVVCVAIAGAAIVWYKTMHIGWPSYVISVVSGVLIALLSLLIWGAVEKEEDEGESSQGS